MDSRHNEGGAEGQLLILHEEVVGVAVEYHAAYRLQRESIFRPDFCDVKGIKLEFIFVGGVHGLQKQLPLGVFSTGDGIVQILSGVAVVLPTHNSSFVIEQGSNTTGGLPVEFHQCLPAFSVYQHECVHSKAFHVTVVCGNTNIIHQEGEHVHCLGNVGEEISNSPSFLDVVFRVGFQRVHHVGEFHAVAYEENGHVVSNQIKIAFSGVEFNCKATGVTQRLGGAALVNDGGETDDEGGLHARSAEEVGTGEVADVVSDLKKTFGRGTTRMDDTLRDAFTIKLSNVGRRKR